MTRDEHRANCIEVMARANHQAFDRLSEMQQIRLRRTAEKYLDALNRIAFVLDTEATEEMEEAGKSWDCSLGYSTYRNVWRAMCIAGDLTNPPEPKP